jgi:hypothetical protein
LDLFQIADFIGQKRYLISHTSGWIQNLLEGSKTGSGKIVSKPQH